MVTTCVPTTACVWQCCPLAPLDFSVSTCQDLACDLKPHLPIAEISTSNANNYEDRGRATSKDGMRRGHHVTVVQITTVCLQGTWG